MSLVTTRLDIEYDGSGFRGWAAQPGRRTVQGELESALATVLREQVTLTVAGRTDAGVHAWGQVASFESHADPAAPGPEAEEAAGIHALVRSLNGLLPGDVSVKAANRAADGFDARRDARARTYCYRVHNRPSPSPLERGRSLWRSAPLDRDALQACAEALPGTHDFTAFTPAETAHVRFEREIFRAEWLAEGVANLDGHIATQTFATRSETGRKSATPSETGCKSATPSETGRKSATPSETESRAGEVLAFWIEADAFMRSMVRVLVGTMIEVASGQRDHEDFASLLEGAPRERAGETAPAHGLYLASVRY